MQNTSEEHIKTPLLYRSRLRNGYTTSIQNTAEYTIWKNMRNRCRSNPAYRRKGISCCDQWTHFKNFWEDICPRPCLMYMRFDLHRIDDECGYEPDNCIWAERKKHMDNARRKRKGMPTARYPDQIECSHCKYMQVKKATMTCRKMHMLCCEYWRICSENPRKELW